MEFEKKDFELGAEIERNERILGNNDRREERIELVRDNLKKIYENLERIQKELNATVNGKIYLIDYFDDLRNQIDTECQLYLCKPGLTNEVKSKALRIQQNMIGNVDRFQKQCLDNLRSNPVEFKLVRLNMRDYDLRNDQLILHLEHDLCQVLYNRKRFLFVNKGLLYFNNAKCEVLFNMKCNNLDKYPQLGILILIQDEFLIYSDKISILNDDYTLLHDWCNELLRLQQMWNEIVKKHMSQETSEVVVLRLNMDKQYILDFTVSNLSDFQCPLLRSSSDQYVTKWIDDLPALRKVDLRNSSLMDLRPSTFCKGTHLTYIDLGFNGIDILYPCSFSQCKNLQVLQLNNNELARLHPDTFNSLGQLIRLDLSGNKLTVLPKGLLKDLTKLECLNAKNNKISTIANEQFKDLVNLCVLDLAINQIKFPCGNGFFKGLSKLNELHLNHNQISNMPEGLFKDLGNLKTLDLSANQITADQMGPNTFEGLGKLNELDLSHNCISALSISVFRGMPKLESLHIRENEVRVFGEGFLEDRALKEKQLLCIMCSAAKTRNCSKCKSVRYCSKECQVNDWPNHKFFCVPFCLNKGSNKES